MGQMPSGLKCPLAEMPSSLICPLAEPEDLNGAADDQCCDVTFTTHFLVNSGEHVICVSGSIQSLGKWDLAKAVKMAQGEVRGYWKATIRLPVNKLIEWKLVLMDTRQKKALRWEERPNRKLTIEDGNSLEIDAPWNSRELTKKKNISVLLPSSKAHMRNFLGMAEDELVIERLKAEKMKQNKTSDVERAITDEENASSVEFEQRFYTPSNTIVYSPNKAEYSSSGTYAYSDDNCDYGNSDYRSCEESMHPGYKNMDFDKDTMKIQVKEAETSNKFNYERSTCSRCGSVDANSEEPRVHGIENCTGPSDSSGWDTDDEYDELEADMSGNNKCEDTVKSFTNRVFTKCDHVLSATKELVTGNDHLAMLGSNMTFAVATSGNTNIDEINNNIVNEPDASHYGTVSNEAEIIDQSSDRTYVRMPDEDDEDNEGSLPMFGRGCLIGGSVAIAVIAGSFFMYYILKRE